MTTLCTTAMIILGCMVCVQVNNDCYTVAISYIAISVMILYHRAIVRNEVHSHKSVILSMDCPRTNSVPVSRRSGVSGGRSSPRTLDPLVDPVSVKYIFPCFTSNFPCVVEISKSLDKLMPRSLNFLLVERPTQQGCLAFGTSW